MFDPDAHLPRINRGTIYLGTCLIAGIGPSVLRGFVKTAGTPGRDRSILFEYVLVLFMRSAMNERLVETEVLLGLSDSSLAKAIAVMHHTQKLSGRLSSWLSMLVCPVRASLSPFRQVVRMTPFDYLTNWRLGLAQTMLRKGNSLKLIASAVGYANATALTGKIL